MGVWVGRINMPQYRVVVTLTCTATIECEDEDQAVELAMLYVGDEGDLSTPEDRARERFRILEVEGFSTDASVLYELDEDEQVAPSQDQASASV